MLLYGTLVLFCCFLYGASAVLSKYALQHDLPQDPDHSWAEMHWLRKVRFAITNKFWIAGWLLGVAANIIIVQVQSSADLSVVYPILNFSYVFTLLLGYVFLKEVLTKDQWLGVGIAILGTIILLFVEDPSTGTKTDFTHLAEVALIALAGIIALVLLAHKDKRNIPEVYYATCAGIAFGNVEVFLKANTNLVITHTGDFSIFSLDSVLAFVTLWPCLLVAAFGIIGFVCMQVAYASGDVSVSVPLITVTQRPVTLFAGFFVFDEAFPVLKIIGILTILLSIVGIASSTVKKGEPQRRVLSVS
jgi:drug/metabolite transporter (DMT)-like permease